MRYNEKWTCYRDYDARSGMYCDEGTTHAVNGGRTICGIRRGKIIEKGGPWIQLELSDSRYPISCQRCLRKLEKDERRW